AARAAASRCTAARTGRAARARRPAGARRSTAARRRRAEFVCAEVGRRADIRKLDVDALVDEGAAGLEMHEGARGGHAAVRLPRSGATGVGRAREVGARLADAEVPGV